MAYSEAFFENLFSVYLSMTLTNKTVLILGASVKVERYSNKAEKALKKHGFDTVLFGLREGDIEGNSIHTSLESVLNIRKDIDTITLYLGSQNQCELLEFVDETKARRVIFNPGTENPIIYKELEDRGVVYEEACTLVLLSLNQFDR
jgi:uncharacterized protein